MMQKDLRRTLILLIAKLQTPPPESKVAFAELLRLKDALEAPEHIFDIANLVWGSTVQALTDPEMQWGKAEYEALRQELRGQSGSFQTYALKHPFVDLLDEAGKQAYQQAKFIVHERLQALAADPPTTLFSEAYEQVADTLSEYQRTPITLADLILAHICTHLFQLPEVASFDILDEEMHGFSSILPSAAVIDVRQELAHLEGMLHKLEGNAVLFVEVGLLPQGYILNIR